MRKIYFIFALSAVAVILLLIFTFLFFEKEKHRMFFYDITIGGENVGYTKADRYRTEDKIIYKAINFRPKKATDKIIREKNSFNRGTFRMQKFIKKYKNSGVVTKSMQIKNSEGTFGFLAKEGSKWASLSDIAHDANISVFDEESVTTYMPFIDRYDFTRGGAQTFNAVYLSSGLLPPARGRIVFRSIRDDYIRVEGKKIKTECLVVRRKALPEIQLWVSKKNRIIVRLEIAKKNLVMYKTSFPKEISINDYAPENISSSSSDILFPSDDIALAGTITMPDKETSIPAVLLVSGETPFNRENAGLYTGISAHLARAGYAVLRFDRRGMGKSQGSNSSVSIFDDIRDIQNALRFLSNHERVDKNKLFVIAHAEACSYLPQLDFAELPVKSLIMLAATKPVILADFESEHVLDEIGTMKTIDEKYAETLARLKHETVNLVKDTKKEYVLAQGSHVFARKMNRLLDFEPLENFAKLDTSLLILHGKKDKFSSPNYIKDIETALLESGREEFRIMHFRNLGHFLGKITAENNTAKYYKVNAEVLETIKGWLDKKCLGL